MQIDICFNGEDDFLSMMHIFLAVFGLSMNMPIDKTEPSKKGVRKKCTVHFAPASER